MMRNLTLKTRRKSLLGFCTLTPLLKIREKNYVIRTREEQDERNLQISLTERGKDIQNVLSDISQSVLMNLILLKKKPKI